MGVIERDNRPFPELIEDAAQNVPEVDANQENNEIELQNNVINNAIDVAAAVEVEEEILRRSAAKKSKPRNPVRPTSTAVKNKHDGAKKNRRYENALMMLDSLNTEEFDEVSIGDFMSSRISAFSKLLEERRNLKLWKDFINCSEEKQAVMLSSCTEAHGNAAAMSSTSAKKSAANHREVGSADVSFHRVGSGFRALIKKKQISMGILSHMENELIDFFTNWPKSVYVSQLPNGYERLILHALCQYLDLIAQSFSGKGSRQTRVENRHQVFSTPPILLTKFLEDNFRL
ncbi:R3H domain containing 4 [Chamberlinius hualienensis]